MKNFIIAIGLVYLSASLAHAMDCPDFTGTFHLSTDPDEVTLTVTQDQCTSVTFAYSYTSTGESYGKTYTLDGVRRQTYEDKSLIVYETQGLQNDAVTNLVEDYYTATQQTQTATTDCALNSDGNFECKDDYYDVNGKLTQSDDNIFIRVTQ